MTENAIIAGKYCLTSSVTVFLAMLGHTSTTKGSDAAIVSAPSDS
jgi:hypothetical protein